MSDPFGKILQKIFDSTLMADHGMDGVYVMMAMVVLSDKDGILNIAPEVFAKRIGMDWKDLKKILNYLEKSDPESNIKDREGRRIIPLDQCDKFPENRGYFVVNKRFYWTRDNPTPSKDRVYKHRKKEQILKLFKDLDYCNVTETLQKRYVTILSISLSISISLNIIKYLIESDVDLYAWMQFEDYRKNKINSPLKTDGGRKRWINVLVPYPQDIQRKMIDISVSHDWSGIYELKGETNGINNSNKSCSSTKKSGAANLYDECGDSVDG